MISSVKHCKLSDLMLQFHQHDAAISSMFTGRKFFAVCTVVGKDFLKETFLLKKMPVCKNGLHFHQFELDEKDEQVLCDSVDIECFCVLLPQRINGKVFHTASTSDWRTWNKEGTLVSQCFIMGSSHH